MSLDIFKDYDYEKEYTYFPEGRKTKGFSKLMFLLYNAKNIDHNVIFEYIKNHKEEINKTIIVRDKIGGYRNKTLISIPLMKWTVLNFVIANYKKLGIDNFVSILLEYGANPNGSKEIIPPLITASSLSIEYSDFRLIDIINKLLKYGANINEKYSGKGITALMCASKNNNYKLVEFLLDRNANVNLRNAYGKNALFLSCKRITNDEHNLRTVKLLMKYGSDANIVPRNKMTLLEYLCFKGKKNLIKLLVNYNVNINTIDDIGGETLLMKLVNDRKIVSEKVIETLLKSGANPNLQDNDGWTALMSACILGKPLLVDTLLKYGANVNLYNYAKDTALTACMYNRHNPDVNISIIIKLINYGADYTVVNAYGKTIFSYILERPTDEQILLFNKIYEIKHYKLLMSNITKEYEKKYE